MGRKFSKTGNGAFSLEVHDDGKTIVSVYPDGQHARAFETPQAAYDEYRPRISDPACWNACYMLETVIDELEPSGA